METLRVHATPAGVLLVQGEQGSRRACGSSTEEKRQQTTTLQTSSYWLTKAAMTHECSYMPYWQAGIHRLNS